jgi:hypothetical protein
MPLFDGMLLKNCSKAFKPPAEAPRATIGKELFIPALERAAMFVVERFRFCGLFAAIFFFAIEPSSLAQRLLLAKRHVETSRGSSEARSNRTPRFRKSCSLFL